MPAKKTSAAKSTKTAPRSSSRQTRRTGKEAALGESLVTIDRRREGRRSEGGDEQAPAAATPALERRKKVQRRRQIDPTTCERDYTTEEVEFMNAMDDYKRKSGRMFPTCSEVLEVIRGLGYVKLSPVDRATLAVEQNLSEQLDVLTDAVDAVVEEA